MYRLKHIEMAKKLEYLLSTVYDEPNTELWWHAVCVVNYKYHTEECLQELDWVGAIYFSGQLASHIESFKRCLRVMEGELNHVG